MKVFRPKTEKYSNYQDDVGSPKDGFFKKGFWKRSNRKKFFKNLFKQIDRTIL